jgi:hypothetical protein
LYERRSVGTVRGADDFGCDIDHAPHLRTNDLREPRGKVAGGLRSEQEFTVELMHAHLGGPLIKRPVQSGLQQCLMTWNHCDVITRSRRRLEARRSSRSSRTSSSPLQSDARLTEVKISRFKA